MKLSVIADPEVIKSLNHIEHTPAQLWIKSRSSKNHTEVFDVIILTDESSELSTMEFALKRFYDENMSKDLKIKEMENEVSTYREICNVVGGKNALFDLIRQFKSDQYLKEKQTAAEEQHSAFLRRMKP